MDELARWAAERAPELIARAEAEAVAELKAALLRAAAEPAPAPRAEPARSAATEPARTPRAAAEPPPAAPPAAEPTPSANAARTGEKPPSEAVPEPATGDALWAYCVARDDAALAGGGPGVAETGALEWIHGDGLAVLTSRVPLSEFGEQALRRNLNDMPWLERTARAHEAAIAAAFERATVIPLRLCTIFSDDDGARRMLADRRDELTAALAALEGREEWSVKLLVDREALAADLRESGARPAEDPGEAGSGAAYLLLRREERRLREAVGDRAARLAEDVHARLQERAVGARVRPAQNRELAGYEGEMILNGAYLVERDHADGLRALVGELETLHRPLGARIELGGPFPPYSFVPESE